MVSTKIFLFFAAIFIKINIINFISPEEKMLHEEIEIRWDDLQSTVQDFNLLEKIRRSIPVGVSSTALINKF